MQIYYFFIIGKMCFVAGWNGFAGQIWPAGRSFENPDIDYEEEWWQHTPLSESNTRGERLWFNSIDTDTIFLAGMQVLDCQLGLPDAFCKNTGHFDLSAVPDLSCVVFRKRHMENREAISIVKSRLTVFWLSHPISVCVWRDDRTKDCVNSSK